MELNYGLLLNLVGACACVAFAAVLITGILVLSRRRKQKANPSSAAPAPAAPVIQPAAPARPAERSIAQNAITDDQFQDDYWNRTDSEAHERILRILAHECPVVDGRAAPEIEKELDYLRKRGDIVVPNILRSILVPASYRIGGGARWWLGANELCKVLAQIGTPHACKALLKLLNTHSTVVEFDQVKASAARQLAFFQKDSAVLVPALIEASKLTHAPLLQIEETITALGGKMQLTPELVIARAANKQPIEAIAYMKDFLKPVEAWNKDQKRYFFVTFGDKVLTAFENDGPKDHEIAMQMARPYYAAAILADPGPNNLGWYKFEPAEKSEARAKEIAAQYPLPTYAPTPNSFDMAVIFPVLEKAYLPVHDPDLIEKVNRELDGIAAKGANGVSILLHRLYQGFYPSGREVIVEFTGDMAWNEWKKKEAIVRALGRAKDPAAVKDLGQLLVKTCSIGMFYDLLVPATIDALAEIGGEEALESLRDAQRMATLDPGNLNRLANKLKAIDQPPAVAEERDENGRTALHRAAYDGQIDVATDLISQGAYVDARDKDDKTPLFLAAGDGHLDVCKLLLQHGADIEAVGCVYTDKRYYYPPLLNAIERKHGDVIRFLLESGANPNVKNEPLKSSALHRAAEQGLQDIVELLIEKGVEVNPRSWTGKTPYTRALDMNHPDIAEYIKQHGGTA